MTTDRQDTVQAPKTEVDPQGILEQMQIAIVTAKSDGAIVTANETAAQLFGVPRADFIGRSLATFVAERHRDSLRNLMRSVPQASPGAKDLTAVHQNGHEFCVRFGLTSAPAKQSVEILATIMEIPSSTLPDKIASEDRRVLETLIHKFGGGPVGLDTIAASIGEESDTIEDVVEPYLLQLGFLDRTPRGRVATARAYAHLDVPYAGPRGAAGPVDGAPQKPLF